MTRWSSPEIPSSFNLDAPKPINAYATSLHRDPEWMRSAGYGWRKSGAIVGNGSEIRAPSSRRKGWSRHQNRHQFAGAGSANEVGTSFPTSIGSSFASADIHLT